MQGRKDMTSQTRVNKLRSSCDTLPPIPEKRYFTIGEVAGLCALKPHVLRYWEQEFPKLKPGKRRGNRRYYQYEDVMIVRQIRKLLYEDGFTIEGARTQLSDGTSDANKVVQTAVVSQLIVELKGILEKLK
jgi:DNA-binding transcriptional MerR regulator